MNTDNKKNKVFNIIVYLFLVFMVFVSIGPFIYVILTALKSPEQVYNPNEIIPSYITFENFRGVLFTSRFPRYFFNSVYITVVTMCICMVLSTMAAYGLTRYRILGANTLKMTILMTRMFPGILLCLPFFIIMKKLGLIDSHIGLIMLYCSITLPFAIWNMCAFFSQLPWELEEAAFIDGCTRLSAFFRVMIHVAKPGMFVTALFSFMSSWDEYMYSLTFINTPEKKTVQVGMKDFVGEYGTDWGMMMAAVTLSLIPALVFFGIVQKHLVTGLSSGAVKG